MKIQNQNDGSRGSFFIIDGDQRIGEMFYIFSGSGKIIINHTEVDDAYEGRGLGRQLVKAGVQYARENNLKILPLCPFAKKIFEITPEFADVLS